jgi:hypothetical protein
MTITEEMMEEEMMEESKGTLRSISSTPIFAWSCSFVIIMMLVLYDPSAFNVRREEVAEKPGGLQRLERILRLCPIC